MSSETKNNQSKKTDSEALAALRHDEASRSKIGRLREIFDEIEATIESGVTRKKILETLNVQGYNLTLATFVTLLQRIRAERAQARSKKPHNPTHEPPRAASTEE